MEQPRSTDPTVAEFMRLVGEKPLLTREEEQRLGIRMDRGRHAQQLIEDSRAPTGYHVALTLAGRLNAIRPVAAAASYAIIQNANPTLHTIAHDPRLRHTLDRKVSEGTLLTIAKMITAQNLKQASMALHPQQTRDLQAIRNPGERRRRLMSQLLAQLSRDTLCLTPSMLTAIGSRRLTELGVIRSNAMDRWFLKALTEDIERELRDCAEDGLNAENEMSECNMRLVVHTARNFIYNNTDLVDLSQEGAIGLIDAAKRFDHRLGYKFSTYATTWIRHRIGKALTTIDRTIRIPHHKHKLAMDMYYVHQRLLQEMSVEPNAADIAQAMGISVELVEEIQRIDRQPESLDAIIWDDTGATQLDRTAVDQPDTDEAAMQRLLKPDLEDALATLDDKERTALIMRYGLHNDQQATITEISEAIHTSKDRARAIERSALQKLRDNPEIIAKLSGHL